MRYGIRVEPTGGPRDRRARHGRHPGEAGFGDEVKRRILGTHVLGRYYYDAYGAPRAVRTLIQRLRRGT